ncbi:MAG TPA: tetratricopeptide repeat protein, partial [Chroococcales cyanobacterium]
LWPGPVDDRGTPLNKIVWQVALYMAEHDIEQGKYPQAEQRLQYAEIKASKFSNKERLQSTLKLMAELYDRWEGHAEMLERTNNEISQIETERMQSEFERQLNLLASFEKPTGSAVRETSNKLRAEAQIPSILSTAAKLSGKGMYNEQEQLLRRATQVEAEKLGKDSASVAQLDLKLAECLLNLRKSSGVRDLLVHATATLKSHAVDKPDEYVRTLNRLGQFDLDQNDFTRAEPELKEALDAARALRGHKDIVMLCMRSYSDLLQRTNRKDEAVKVMQEADALDRPGH